MFVLGSGQNHVHEHLERRWGVTHSKIHDFWLERAKTRFERRLPLITILDSYVVVPPSYVEFGEYPGILNLLDEIWDQG